MRTLATRTARVAVGLCLTVAACGQSDPGPSGPGGAGGSGGESATSGGGTTSTSSGTTSTSGGGTTGGLDSAGAAVTTRFGEHGRP